jgi:uncharacterized protein YpmS
VGQAAVGVDALSAKTRVLTLQILPQLLENGVVQPDVSDFGVGQIPETELRNTLPDAAEGHVARAKDA